MLTVTIDQLEDISGADIPKQGPVSRKSRQLFGPEIKYSNRNIKNKRAGPGYQTTPFVSLTDSFIMLDAKLLKPRSLM